MKKLLTLLFFFPLFALGQTCDVDLIGYDVETNQVSIAILNGENCGCNEYTQQDGNTCDESSGSAVNNNESITHFVFGLHIYEDFTDGPCSQANFHPGWAFAYPPDQTMLPFTGGHVTGDTLNVELNTFFDWDCLLEQDFDEECLEMVVWQINLGQTVDIEDFPTEYWTDTCGTCANQTQMYPDIDLSNNTLVWCPDELPPSPLYPGCTDEEADNYDPIATFNDGSCEYTILGCLNPIACNYNDEATVDDGSCIVCDTPNGEELCNAYHNSDGYWDYYIDLFNCPLTGDITMDTLVIVEADCDVFNLGVTCNEGIRFHTTYTNTGLDSIYTWKITWTGPNGFIAASDQGVDGDQPPPYNVPLPPGITAPTINTITTQMLWQEGDTLCATASLVGQIELTPEDNIICTTLPAYPVCIPDCTDPLASNYNMTTECTDNSLCEYLPIIDVGLDTILYETGCNELGAYWLPTFYLTNYGEVPITELCVVEDILSSLPGNDTVCFNNFTIPPGETYELGWPYEYEWGVLSVRIINVNGESDQPWNDFGLDTNIENNMYVQIISNEPNCISGCTDINAINYNPLATIDDGSCIDPIIGCMVPNALNYNPEANVTCEPIEECCIFPETELLYIDLECDLYCDETGAYYNAILYFDNIGNTTITNFCINYDILSGPDVTECFYGELPPGENIIMEFGPITSDGGGGVIIRLETLEGEETDITWAQSIACYFDAAAICIFGCTDPEANNYDPNAEWDNGTCDYDIFGCTDPEALNYNSQATVDDSSCVYLELCDGSYFIPNTFTPNNDGLNDGWEIIIADESCWRAWNVQIYNRWGGLVWESNTVGEIWPASMGSGNYYVADGVYLYKVQGVGWDPSNTFTNTGHITIFR